MSFLLSLFGMTDRVKVASDRTATAVEDIATMMESVRDQLRERLGYTPAQLEDNSEKVSKKRTK